MSDHHFRKFLKIEKECWNSNESIWISLKRFETIQNVIRVVSDFVTTGEGLELYIAKWMPCIWLIL